MGIKETPTNFRVYYSSMKDYYTNEREKTQKLVNDLKDEIDKLYVRIDKESEMYKEKFKINLYHYEEFRNNEYINGTFLKDTKGLFLNKKDNYKLVSDLFDLYNLANKQKQLSEAKHNISLYERCLNLSLKQYCNILKMYYNEVHKRMIIDGEGYDFGNNVGWTCINRCHINRQKPMLDYKATKEKRKQLINEGVRIYNKEDKIWCERNGIEYNATDARVYRNDEYCYEIPLIGCKLTNGSKFKLEITDYRGTDLRGMTNQDIIDATNSDVNKICRLNLDVRTKLNLCNKIDKTLYLNFIRNENQKPINATKASR